MAWTIEPVTFADVLPMAREAARAGVKVAELSARTEWIAARQDGAILGFAALTFLRLARVRAVYVRPAARKQGIGTALVERLLERARECALSVDVFAYNASFYEARGFRRHGRRPNGALHLVRPA